MGKGELLENIDRSASTVFNLKNNLNAHHFDDRSRVRASR